MPGAKGPWNGSRARYQKARSKGQKGKGANLRMIEYLTSQGWDPSLATFVSIFLGVVAVASFGLGWFSILGLWLERKFAARVQDRMGPNRVGPSGLLQV